MFVIEVDMICPASHPLVVLTELFELCHVYGEVLRDVVLGHWITTCHCKTNENIEVCGQWIENGMK